MNHPTQDQRHPDVQRTPAQTQQPPDRERKARTPEPEGRFFGRRADPVEGARDDDA
jgi:hypothetical protein